MTKTIGRLIASGVLAVLTGAMALLAKTCNEIFFSFYPALSRKLLGALASVTAFLPVAVWELLVGVLAIWFVVSLILALGKRRFIRWLTGVLLIACILATCFVGSWGLNYYAPKMQTSLGLPVREYTTAELREAATYYRDMANETAALVQRDGNGVMADCAFDTLAEQAGEGFAALSERYDCFNGSTARVKRLLLSDVYGKFGTTGIFVCLTGESGACTTAFSASLPFTMCHEIAHRMAFAREDEASFAGYLACEAGERPEFRYSGYYSAFIYCINALYKVDAAAAREIRSGCCAELSADCAAAVEHYEKIENEKAVETQDKVYDTYLKTFSVDSGVRSYGEVTDLLITWYFERLK